jgi:hypothetical protein
MKYGIVKTSKLLQALQTPSLNPHLWQDLLEWDYLYLAGRLQKPVMIFSKPTAPATKELHEQILGAIERNR